MESINVNDSFKPVTDIHDLNELEFPNLEEDSPIKKIQFPNLQDSIEELNQKLETLTNDNMKVPLSEEIEGTYRFLPESIQKYETHSNNLMKVPLSAEIDNHFKTLKSEQSVSSDSLQNLPTANPMKIQFPNPQNSIKTSLHQKMTRKYKTYSNNNMKEPLSAEIDNHFQTLKNDQCVSSDSLQNSPTANSMKIQFPNPRDSIVASLPQKRNQKYRIRLVNKMKAPLSGEIDNHFQTVKNEQCVSSDILQNLPTENLMKIQSQYSDNDQIQLADSDDLQKMLKHIQVAKTCTANIKALSSQNIKSYSQNFLKEESVSRDSLISLQEIIEEATKYINSIIKHENTVVFFGFSKSGKSSLVNYIIGNELIGMKKNRLSRVGIAAVNKSNGPEIGLEAASKTILPTRWENLEDLPQLALVDTPGFNDNRSPIQDIKGAYYIYQVFQNIKSVKIVLVIDVNDIINDRINEFLTILHSVENMLNGNMVDCFSSIVVVFTKVPDQMDGFAVDKEFICEIMEEKILSDSDMQISDTVKKFVQYLIENNENIGLFLKAKEGPITSEIEVNIFEAVRNANSIEEKILKSITPCIADKSKVFLHTASEKLLFKQDFYEFQLMLSDIFHSELSKFSKILISSVSNSELVSIQRDLNDKKNKIDELFDIDTFHEKINALRNINPKIKSKVDDNKLIEISKIVKFFDALLKTKKSEHFDLTLQQTLRNVVDRVNSLLNQIKLKLNEINQEELQNRLEKLERDSILKMKRLEIETERIAKYNEDLKLEMDQLAKENEALKNASNCTIL